MNEEVDLQGLPWNRRGSQVSLRGRVVRERD